MIVHCVCMATATRIKHKYRVNESVFSVLFEPQKIKPTTVITRPAKDIGHYIDAGWPFERVCRIVSDTVNPNGKDLDWMYTMVNEQIMFAPNRHWVYAITVNGRIYKWGECANPLGIRQKTRQVYLEAQPKQGTRSRLGRYRTHGGDSRDTDWTIRHRLNRLVANPNYTVEFWAMKCTEYHEMRSLGAFKQAITASNNKETEHWLLDYYQYVYGKLPLLNKVRG